MKFKRYISGVIKWWEGLFLIITLTFLCIGLVTQADPLQITVKSDFAKQILYAIFTAVLTTVIFTVYSRVTKVIRNGQYFGEWIILKFDNIEDYKPTEEIALIRQGDDVSSLRYSQEDCNNMNSKSGIIYINPHNTQIGELMLTYDWLNQTKSIYPVSVYKIFFDIDTDISKGLFPTIKVFDGSGNEEFILQRASDQKEYMKFLYGKRSDTMEQMSTSLDDLINGNEKKD